MPHVDLDASVLDSAQAIEACASAEIDEPGPGKAVTRLLCPCGCGRALRPGRRYGSSGCWGRHRSQVRSKEVREDVRAATPPEGLPEPSERLREIAKGRPEEAAPELTLFRAQMTREEYHVYRALYHLRRLPELARDTIALLAGLLPDQEVSR